MEWGIVRNGVVFFFIALCVFFLGAFGILYFLPMGTVLDISLWWQILLPLVLLLIHIYIGFFTGRKCLLYSNLFNAILWVCWLFFLIWFLPVLLNLYTVLIPILLLSCLGFLGGMLGKSLGKVVDAEKKPPQE